MAEKEDDKPKVTPDEMAIINSGPAFFSNKMYLTVGGTVARITFAEQQQGAASPAFRAAVVLTLGDLLKLRELIDRLTKDVRLVQVNASKQDG